MNFVVAKLFKPQQKQGVSRLVSGTLYERVHAYLFIYDPVEEQRTMYRHLIFDHV